jgi:pimeloyl-ACP methyl ester carboxylesterase
MKNEIEDRELLALKGPNGTIPLTHHKARNGGAPAGLSQDAGGRVGILFLNSMSPSRAARGDSSVRWAEWHAELGYPAFRLDLPGFGDSDTDPPPALQDFVNLGGYATSACAAIDQLVAQFRLSGVVLFGLCAGALTAIYTAAASRECRGMVLLDPYFHLPLVAKPSAAEKLGRLVPPGVMRRTLRTMAEKIRAARKRHLKKQLPENANLGLLDRWGKATSKGLPVLIINAPTNRPKEENFNYIDYIRTLNVSEGQVTLQAIQGADHTFSNRRGLDAVKQHTEDWLGGNFPLARYGGSAIDAVDTESTVVR